MYQLRDKSRTSEKEKTSEDLIQYVEMTQLHGVVLVAYLATLGYGLSTTLPVIRANPTVEEWILMKTCVPMLSIICFYYLFIITGPKLLSKLPAFRLRLVLRIHNFSQIILSAYICKEFLLGVWQSNYSLLCQPLDFSTSPHAVRISNACWWFFFSKIVDTFDTIFLILRKKYSQVTFLHVYHHGTMILNWWFAAKYIPGGQSFFQCTANSFVHVVMYTYYFLSTFGPKIRKHLWWKRYLTQLQLTQFCAIIIHLVAGMMSQCNFPYDVNSYIIIYCSTLIVLFVDFYFNAYRKQNEGQRKSVATLSSKSRQSNGLYNHVTPKKLLTNHSIYTSGKEWIQSITTGWKNVRWFRKYTKDL